MLTFLFLSGAMLCGYGLAYFIGRDHGERAAREQQARDQIDVSLTRHEAVLLETTSGKFQLLVCAPDAEPPEPGIVRWRGLLPSRNLVDASRFAMQLVRSRPWETRQ